MIDLASPVVREARDWLFGAVAILGTLWAVLKYVFQPHVTRTVRTAMHSDTQRLTSMAQRLALVEDAVNELRRDGREQDTALKELRTETAEGFRRTTATLERIDENAQEVAKAVARIEGRMEARAPRHG